MALDDSEQKSNETSRWLAAHWRCPRCSSPVRLEGGIGKPIFCSNDSCLYARRGFPVVIGQPALVDFESSVLDENALKSSEGGSAIHRSRAPARQMLRRILFGPNRVAERNAPRFLDEVKNVSPRPTVLVVGGGSTGEGADAIYRDPAVTTVSFDIYASPDTQFVGDTHAIPLASLSVDGVWIQAVLEHVLTPAAVVAEIHRVLKDGGVVYAESPFIQQVHEGAWDFTRFTESGHRWLFRDFALIDSGTVLGPGTALVWSIRYAIAALFRSRAVGTIAGAGFFWLRFLDYIASPRFALDAACAVYFMGKKAGRAIGPKEAVLYYRGAGRSISH